MEFISEDATCMMANCVGLIALLFVNNSTSIGRRLCLLLLAAATLVLALIRLTHFSTDFSAKMEGKRKYVESLSVENVSDIFTRGFELIKDQRIEGLENQFCGLYKTEEGTDDQYIRLCVTKAKRCDGIIDLPWNEESVSAGPPDEIFCPSHLSFALICVDVSLWITAAISSLIIFVSAIGFERVSSFIHDLAQTLNFSTRRA